MDVLFDITVILLFGLFTCNLIKRFKLPNVIGYLLAGIIIGPFLIKFLDFSDLEKLDILSMIALGIVSFLIGAELRINNIKKIGSKPFIMSIVISLTTFIIVSSGLFIISNSLVLSLILGSIASATAPPTIMMIFKQYHAKGKLTNHILGIMAIDDITSIILFGFSLMIAKNINNEIITFNQWLDPLKEILLSLLVGISSGIVLGIISKYFAKGSDNLIVSLLFIFIPIIICDYIDLSPFLTFIIMGFTFVNLFKVRLVNKISDTIDYFSVPILLIFFVISGANIDFKLIPLTGLITLAYILFRTIGKIIGAYLGGSLVKSDLKIKKNLGCCLLSQTGVAIGLATTTLLVLPKEGEIIVAIIIVSSFVFDIISPFILKNRLKFFNEIK